MRFASLGSGSRGNALLVEAGRTRILLDCGFGPRTTAARLARLGCLPETLSAIVLTHEHSDHVAGAFAVARRWGLRVWMTHGTFCALPAAAEEAARVERFDPQQPFRIGDLAVHPFPVPHDAREPVQFVFSDGRHRLGVLTDLGCTTPHVARMLDGCDALVLECNHDGEMLRRGSYPEALKRRIAGRLGHLDNAAAAALLEGIDAARLQHVVAAHLSQQNNTPALARRALATALGCAAHWIAVADQEEGLGWRELL